jgi:transcriptional adapter 3
MRYEYFCNFVTIEILICLFYDKTDDTEFFRVPKLGRHYSEAWEEETVPPEPLPGTTTEPLTESDLNMQKKGLGPLTERVISALLSVPGQPPPKKGDDDNPAPNASGTTTQLAPVSFHDMETRLKLELRACGLLGTEEVSGSRPRNYDRLFGIHSSE